MQIQKQRFNRAVYLFLAVAASITLFSQSAWATLTVFETYTGNYGLSTDGFGSTTNSGTISADVPVGATVVAAYLYSATYGGSSTPSPLGTVTLNGTAVTFNTTYVNPIPPSLPNWFNTGRSDVTSIVAPVVNGGPGGIYNFTVTESEDTTDGEALVVVYSLPSLPTATVAILDGGASLTGDTTTINFSNPLNPSDPGFFAEIRIGDSFSCCGQTSTITVNGTQLTDVAGNNDDGADGFEANGNLITVGGIGDPTTPNAPGYGDDHERYNLVPFVNNGDTTITVNTVNPSNDDNIFLLTFYGSGAAGVNAPPPVEEPPTNSVPEPNSILLIGIGMTAFWFLKRKAAA